MSFDFYELYKDFPTAELLKIARRPEEYQPEAVEAASRRLSERVVAPEDEASVQTFYEEIELEARQKAEKLDVLKGQAADLLLPILRPGTNVSPQKWLNIFLLMIGLQFAWQLIQSLTMVCRTIFLVVFAAGFGVHEPIGFENAASHLLNYDFLFNVVELLYLPLFFYLLYKKRRWGWILVFASILFGLLGVPMQAYSYFIYSRAARFEFIPLPSMGWLLAQTLLKVAFAWFLWRQDISDIFRVDKSTKVRTVLYTTVCSILLFGVLWFIF
jgi:hypothetical protein